MGELSMNLSIIHQIAQKLENHENSKRIRKLMFYACTKQWTNDQSILEQFTLPELVGKLWHLNPTVTELKSNLSAIANTLSKPEEYINVANIIISKLEIIYDQKNQETEILTPQNYQKYTIKNEYNKFDIRQNIMRLTNPLRAKIVLFSAVYDQFNFKPEDWGKLRVETLDSLIAKLLDSCATFSEVESKLSHSVLSLGRDDANRQAANTISRFMKNLYSDIVSTKEPSNYQHSNNEYENEYYPTDLENMRTETLINTNNHNQEETQINNSINHINTVVDFQEDDFDDDDDFNLNDVDSDNTCQVIEPNQRK